MGEGTGPAGRLSLDEWVVVIGFTPSKDTIALWLLGHKPRAALGLFGAKLVLGAGWVHSAVFDDPWWGRKGEGAQVEVDKWAEKHFQRRYAGQGNKHCLFVTCPVDKRTSADERQGEIRGRLVWSKQATRDEPPFKLGAWIIAGGGWGEYYNGEYRNTIETGSDWADGGLKG